MLYEIKNARKFDNNKRIRWFTDNYFDLSVWYEDDELVSFQLSYDKLTNPHALTWKKDTGFLHELIDDGEIPGKHKMSPILLPDGDFPRDEIAERFKRESKEIDKEIAQFIYEQIIKYKN